jgi:hypothetical protein
VLRRILLCLALTSSMSATTVAAARATTTPAPVASPSAAGFAAVFVVTTNRYASAHGDRARIGDADCVEAARGRYMCSYAVRRPGVARECHLMQARWTPRLASTFTITLSGRVKRCATLKQALRSLH